MRSFHFHFYPCMQTSRLHTPCLNGTPTIQPVEELVEVKIEVNCELIVPAHFHPANHGADHHFLCLDSGRIVQISKGKDIIVLALQLLRDGFRFQEAVLDRFVLPQEGPAHPPILVQRTLFGAFQFEILRWIMQFKYGSLSDPVYRRRIIDVFVNSVYIFDDKIVFTYNFKDGTDTFSLKDVTLAIHAKSSDVADSASP